MHIVLLRRGSRALILPGGKDLIDCPLLVRHWLGAPDTRCATELTRDTPLPGIAPLWYWQRFCRKASARLMCMAWYTASNRPCRQISPTRLSEMRTQVPLIC